MNISVVGFDELRRIRADDLSLALTKTYAAAFAGGDWNEEHDPDDLMAEWTAFIANEGHTFVECRRNNVVVGGGGFAPLINFPDKADLLPAICDGSVYINEVWVDPKYQGQQIGRFILVNMEQMIHGEGYKKISLWTHYTSDGLIKFYSVNGYRAEADVKPKDGGITRKVFFKDLNEPMTMGGRHHD